MRQHIALVTVELLRLRETAQFIPDTWLANSCDLDPVDQCICVGHHAEACICQIPIHNTHEVWRRRLVETWDEFHHSVVDDAINIIN